MSAEASPAESRTELVEHVDVDGSVIEIVTRAQVRAHTLRHRCSYVFVLRPTGHLVVHQRADWKSIYPSWWDLCFGGICGVGESWTASAARELAEEAGLCGQVLHPLGAMSYDAADGRVVGQAYAVVTDAAVVAVDGEVAALDEIDLDDLGPWMAGRSVCHDSRSAVLPLLTASGVVAELLGHGT